MAKKRFDPSIPRRMYHAFGEGQTLRCPECQSALVNESHTYMTFAREGDELNPFIVGSDFGYFCPQCPVVLIDMDAAGEMLSRGIDTGPIMHFGVAGLIDLDAVPEEKARIPLGDDNPPPLVQFLDTLDLPQGTQSRGLSPGQQKSLRHKRGKRKKRKRR